ncbi:Sulfatase-modifying factor 2 [Hondaea fermentalgiana]|uniref:Sulfatase-modifying factor 2 n=1 Tax=Hondaea fermentalgiana TaxID=2315210 RepID=A0A2R5G4N1_9STRA|nr:Sulfatase-modifying factor 2 [Hondaea fermentalgiana]|eukprot:GBG25515.1 Sulfatase-modifying factor 2 [Hondaea fermentalgiana]
MGRFAPTRRARALALVLVAVLVLALALAAVDAAEAIETGARDDVEGGCAARFDDEEGNADAEGNAEADAEASCGCADAQNRASALGDMLEQDKQKTAQQQESSVKTTSAEKHELDSAPVFDELQAYIEAGHMDPDLVRPMPMVFIPAGEFTMGTDDPQIPGDAEGPARRVRLSEFELDEMEVSNRQFAEFVLDTKYVTEAESFGWSFCFLGTLSEKLREEITVQVQEVPWWAPVNGANWLHPDGPDSDVVLQDKLDYPVTHVTHNDARAYCEWAGKRLPREAEFERAAKGDLEGVLFPWGAEMTPNGTHRANLWQGHFPENNTGEDGYVWASPVDSFGAQNKFGLKNIIGNVWEWVADAWNTRHHLTAPGGGMLTDFQVEIAGRIDDPAVERVKKGGSYMCHISYCYRYRVDARSHNTADSSSQNLGFRCARDTDED